MVGGRLGCVAAALPPLFSIVLPEHPSHSLSVASFTHLTRECLLLNVKCLFSDTLYTLVGSGADWTELSDGVQWCDVSYL